MINARILINWIRNFNDFKRAKKFFFLQSFLKTLMKFIDCKLNVFDDEIVLFVEKITCFIIFLNFIDIMSKKSMISFDFENLSIRNFFKIITWSNFNRSNYSIYVYLNNDNFNFSYLNYFFPFIVINLINLNILFNFFVRKYYFIYAIFDKIN